MAAKSVLKNSASALLALALGTAALIPSAALAQERDQRGAGRMERIERMERMEQNRPAQAPAWQGRAAAPAPAPAPQQPSWSGRPTFSQGSGPAPQPQREGAWQGRPAWQGGGNGGEDRERGDRGNGAYANGQPTFGGRPGWNNNGAPQATPGSAPTWQGRNPTYVDPARNPQANRDNRWAEGRNDERGDQRDWQRDRDRDRDGQRDWQRDRNNNNWQGRDNRWAGNNGWRGNNGWQGRDDRRWGYNNGWRGDDRRWGYNNGWRGNAWGYNNNWRRWDRDGWRRDNRYDWYGWRNRHRSTFSLGFYSAPWRGYSYSRFAIGVTIGAPFYDERYWIADPWAYRLPDAWGPYRWVRYYDDALLVDIYTGEVVDAIYDIFW